MRIDPTKLDALFEPEKATLVLREMHAGQQLEICQNADYRWLHFGDGAVQSALDLNEPTKLVLDYFGRMLFPAMFGNVLPALHLGLGGGSLLRFLQDKEPDGVQVAVEYSARVVELATQYFSVPSKPPISLVIEDAVKFVGHHLGEYRTLFVDLFVDDGVPFSKLDTAFWQRCKRLLGNGADGVVVLNTMPYDPEAFTQCVERMRDVYAGQLMFLTVPGFDNVLVFAFNAGLPDLDQRTWDHRARNCEAHWGLPFVQYLRDARNIHRAL